MCQVKCKLGWGMYTMRQAKHKLSWGMYAVCQAKHKLSWGSVSGKTQIGLENVLGKMQIELGNVSGKMQIELRNVYSVSGKRVGECVRQRWRRIIIVVACVGTICACCTKPLTKSQHLAQVQ